MSKRSARVLACLSWRTGPGVAFIKDHGVCYLHSFLPSCSALQIYLTLGFLSQCNKMSCPNCNTFSCYICRQVITGYDHFNQFSVFAVPLSDFIPFSRFYLVSTLFPENRDPCMFFRFLACNSLIVVWWLCHSNPFHSMSFTDSFLSSFMNDLLSFSSHHHLT